MFQFSLCYIATELYYIHPSFSFTFPLLAELKQAPLPESEDEDCPPIFPAAACKEAPRSELAPFPDCKEDPPLLGGSKHAPSPAPSPPECEDDCPFLFWASRRARAAAPAEREAAERATPLSERTRV